jgi:beta-phosphoglucomutase-like phosphatase (HAD superfamily)
MKAQKLIILDFDGTIIASEGIWKRIYKMYCQNNKFRYLKWIDALFGNIAFDDWISQIKNAHQTSIEYDKFLHEVYNIAISCYCEKEPVLGFKQFADKHISDCMIVVSKEEPFLIDAYLKHYGIKNAVTILQDANDLRHNCFFYKNIANRNGFSIEKTIFIDDSLSHCCSAKESGVYVVGINDSHSSERQKQMMSVCDIYVENFKEILGV